MGVIIPAILTSSRKEVEEQLALVKGLVDTVQIDAVDGRFVSPPTWPYNAKDDELTALIEAGTTLPEWGHFRYEMDLMVANPEAEAERWVSLGAQRILVHVESTKELAKIIDNLGHRYGHDKGFAPDLISFGLAINVDTDSEALEPFADRIDYVQFMGIATIGKQGIPFDPRVLKKIEAFRKRHPEMTIQVDGGVSLQTAPDLLAAGADRLVAGSAIWKAPDIAEAIHAFEDIGALRGLYR